MRTFAVVLASFGVIDARSYSYVYQVAVAFRNLYSFHFELIKLRSAISIGFEIFFKKFQYLRTGLHGVY